MEESWVDIDAETMHDPCQVGLYAAHIFQYYKEREVYSNVFIEQPNPVVRLQDVP